MANKVTVQDIQLMMNDYKIISEFIKKFPKVTLAEFDHYSVSDMSLFVVREDLNFGKIDRIVDEINNCLPAINRIFIKPIIQLVELDEVIPIEAVRTINNKSMQHISAHSELWDNITKDGIKPQKLMSRTYQDNYSIYENIVFAHAINEILAYLRANKRYFQDLLYASKVLQYNILERVNHLDYFLAIGKLHTGYIRGFDKYYETVKPIYEKINTTYDKVSSKLKYNVYKKNKNFKGKLVLRQTNILHMHKDYHKVYNLLKYFEKNNLETRIVSKKEIAQFDINYFNYCNILLIFSLIHFGFVCDKNRIIDLEDTDAPFMNRTWMINVKKITQENNYILLEITKDTTYRVILEPIALKSSNVDINYPDHDERIVLSPIEEIKDTTYISLYDIDSFRKFQQIILRGMILSDKTRDDCPFCDGKLIKKDSPDKYDDETYVCKSCNTLIGERTCDIYHSKYVYSKINNYNVNKNEDNNLSISAKYHYRNITDMTVDGDVICPTCHKLHRNVKK